MTTPIIDGWFTTDEARPALLGTRCCQCGTFYFPKQSGFCRNPDCDSEEFEDTPLSRTGRLWSFTNACYQPPPPFVAADPYQPFAIAAVELEAEKMTVLGQVVEGIGVDELSLGMEMELVMEPVPGQDEERMCWKWRPREAQS